LPSKWYLSFRFPNQYSVLHLLSPLYATCPTYFILLNFISWTASVTACKWWRISLMQFSPISSYFLLLSPQHLPQYPTQFCMS
jgi:hypothetical protein